MKACDCGGWRIQLQDRAMQDDILAEQAEERAAEAAARLTAERNAKRVAQAAHAASAERRRVEQAGANA